MAVTVLVPNESLADHLPDAKNRSRCQSSSFTRILQIAAGIAFAIGVIPSRGTIHRDLKLDNVMLELESTFVVERAI
jgi:serine/threonine protein kinase